MRNRYSKILCLLLLFACCLPQEGNAFWPFKKKKKEDKKENLTPYQKLFKNKKVQTAHGLMTIHKVEGKVYVEFPVAMLGREMLFASSIENTSDGGEGAPGQLGGTDVRFRFEMIDSTLVARMPLLSKPVIPVVMLISHVRWTMRIIRVFSKALRYWLALRIVLHLW